MRRSGWAVITGGVLAATVGLAPLSGATGEGPPDSRPAGSVVDWGSRAQQEPPPAHLTDAVEVSGGESFVVALRADGTVATWGGSGTPAPPAGLTGVTQVSGGTTDAAALRSDGTAILFGPYSSSGEELGGGLVQVDAGSGFAAALTSAGTVRVSGRNLSGQLDVPPGLDDVVAVSAGGYRGVSASPCGFGLALRDDGTVVGWGHNTPGVGCTEDMALDATPPPGLDHVVAISAGAQHSLALRADGTVVGWGYDAEAATPPPGLAGVVQVAAGHGHSLALKADGTVVQWGGGGDAGEVPAGLTDVASVATASFGHTVAVVVPQRVGAARVMPRPDSNPAGVAEAFATTAESTGPVGRLRVFLDESSRARRVVVGLYSQGGDGGPGRLLTSGTIAAPVAGRWNEAAVPPVALTEGRRYWLALLGPTRSGTVVFRDQADGVGGPARTSAQRSLTDLPAVWRSGGTFGNAPASLYGVG